MGSSFCPLQLKSLISPKTHTPPDAWQWRSHLSWTSLLIVGLLLLKLFPNSVHLQLNFIYITMFFQLTLAMFLKRQWLLKETGFPKERVTQSVHWQGLCSRFSGDSLSVCACVWERMCECVVTHRSHSHPVPLHVSLFIPLSFGHLTKTNDSASEMSSSLVHKQVEGGGGRDVEGETERGKKMQSRLVPLFSVWLCCLVWCFEIDLRTHQTWFYRYCFSWNGTSIKPQFILNPSCWCIQSWSIWYSYINPYNFVFIFII